MDNNQIILKLNNLSSGYNATTILTDVNLAVKRDEILLLVGPNGAGKSTLLKTIFGFLKVKAGTIHYNGDLLNGIFPHNRVKRGMSYVFQERRIFERMTVEDNLRTAYQRNGRSVDEALKNVYERYKGLFAKRDSTAGWLSGGEQQMLAIGRVLMQTPRIILFDEPSEGLAPQIAHEVFEQIRILSQEGITCIIVEHRIKEAMKIADRVVGMKAGKIQFINDCSILSENMQKVLNLFVFA